MLPERCRKNLGVGDILYYFNETSGVSKEDTVVGCHKHGPKIDNGEVLVLGHGYLNHYVRVKKLSK